jgi:hypothetical protein
MSGYSQELVSSRGELPEGSRVLPKPFTRRVLLATVAECLGPRDA